MCQAILEMIEDGRQEGRQEERQQGMKLLVESFQELGISKESTFLKVKEKYQLTEEQVNEKLELFWVGSSSALVDATK